MQNIKKEKSNKKPKKVLIILSIPLAFLGLYYINILGIYFGIALKKLMIGIIC